MVWYQNLDRSKPYLKNFRRWSLWYDYNNAKHHEIKKMRMNWLEAMMRRFFKHEAYFRFFAVFCGLPFLFFLKKSMNRYSKPAEPEESFFLFKKFCILGHNTLLRLEGISLGTRQELRSHLSMLCLLSLVMKL
jgi:hypothetical protein